VEVYYAFPPQELIKDVAHRDSNGAPVAVSVRQDQSELVFQILDAQYRDTEVRLTYDALLDALQVTQANSPAPATAEEKAAFLVEMCRRLELVKLHVPGNAGRREGSPTSGARRGLYHIEFGSPQEYDASAVEGELSGAALAALAAEAAAGPQGPTFAELRKDGRRALMRGDFVEAAGLLQHAVDLQTDTADPKLWRDLGIALFEAWREEDDDGSVRDAWTVASMQRLDTAHAAYTNALRFVENTLNPEVWAEAARLYLCLGAFEACADAGRRVVSSFASSALATEVLFIAAIALKQLGVYDEAVTYLEYLETSPPASAPKQLVQIVLALTHDQMGNAKEASKAYARCFDDAKRALRSRERRGDDVLELKARSWQTWHADPRLWLRMTLLAEVADHWILAVELQKEAVRRTQPPDASAHWRLAECAWRARQVEDAVKAGDEACRLAPKHRFYREVLGLWKEYQYSKSFQVEGGQALNALTQGGTGNATADDRQILSLRAFLSSKNGGAGLTPAARQEAHLALVELTAAAATKSERRVGELKTQLAAAQERLGVIREAASAAATVDERKKAALKLQEVFRKQAMRKLTPLREEAAAAAKVADAAEAVQTTKLAAAKEAMGFVNDEMAKMARHKKDATAQAEPADKKITQLRHLTMRVKAAQEASDAAQVEYHTAKTDAKAKRAAARDLALKVRCCHLLFGVVNIVCLSLRRASIDREPG
jgi:tetratricopeptide (TPR) repeat protein